MDSHRFRTLVLSAVFCCAAAAAQEMPAPRLGVFSNQPARAVPSWMRRIVIYQMWLHVYGPPDALRHAEERLEQVAALGATMVQLSPIHPHQGGPYSVNDYYAIAPEYGTEADLRQFVAHAHKLGLKVILDMVYFHAGLGNRLLKEHPEMFLHDAQGKIVLGRWNLPRFDGNRPETRKYFTDNLIYWITKFDVDGFRADVAGGLPTAFWAEAHAAVDKARPGVFFLAEASSPELMLRGFDATYGVMHMLALQFILRDGQPAASLRQNWENDQAHYPKGTLMIRALDNHDQRRAVSEFGNNGALAGMAINLTMDGIPFIYNGQEIGDTTPISVGPQLAIRWQSGPTRAVVFQGKKRYRGSYAGQDLPIYKKLIRIRRESPAITEGELRWLTNSDEERIVSFLRKKEEQEIVVVVNTSNRPWKGSVNLSDDDYPLTDLMSDEPVASFPPHSLVNLSLDSFGWLIAKREPARNLPK